MKKIYLLFTLFLCVLAIHAQQQNITKIEADSAYIRGDFGSSIQIYEALLAEGEDPELYYNLGNAYYKSENIAKAILNYERALLLNPGNSDIRVNLEIARAKTIDKVNPIPEIFFISWTKAIINTLSIDSWAKISIISFLLLLGCSSLYIFTKQVLGKKIGFIGFIVFFIITILGNVFAKQQIDNFQNRNDAIVLIPNVTIRSTPSESGTSLFVLHKGRKVQIKDNSMREWKEITLEDGKVGWIPSSAIEII